jgi:DHA3 family tetracycline resistance protein-like MFS transporter
VTRDPIKIYLRSAVAGGFFFTLAATLSMVFLIVRVGLNPLQMLLVGSVLEGTVLVFEIPTGVVADSISRRTSVIIGMLVTGAGFMLYSVPSFPVVLLAQVVWGLGYTFVSGAFVAWLTDEVGEAEAVAVYLKSTQRMQLGAFVAIGISVALGSIALWLPLFVGGLGYLLLGVWLLVVMPETGFVRPERTEHTRMRDTLVSARDTVRSRPVIALIFGVAALHGMSTEGFDRLWELHLIKGIGLPAAGHLDKIVWFGLLRAAALLIGVVALGRVRRRLRGASHAGQLLAFVNAGMMVAVIAFALAGNFAVAVVAFLAVTVLNQINGPLYTAWLNSGLDARSRATVNSIGSQVDALGQVVGGPGLGAIATFWSVPTAMVCSAFVRVPAAALFALSRRRDRRERDEGAAVPSG